MLPNRLSFIPFLALGIILGLAIMLLLGCREDLVAPERVEHPFSLYGVLTPDLATQSMLVFPIEGVLQERSPEPLDAAVTSTDLTTGEVRIWNDSLTVDSLGHYEHVFWSDFRGEHGYRYRIEATRQSDGTASSVEVTIPEAVKLRLEEPEASVQPLRVEVKDARLIHAAVHYTVRFYNPTFEPVPTPRYYTYVVSYAGKEQKVQDGWEIDFLMLRDYNAVASLWSQESGYDGSHGHEDDGLALISMEFNVLVGNEEWDPPGGVFDPNLLSHVGTMKNVENGFGFVGGGYRISEKLYPPKETIEEAGFFYVPWLIR